jgi:hypothetical protein
LKLFVLRRAAVLPTSHVSVPSVRIVVNVTDDNTNWKHSKVEGLRKIIRGLNENRHPWNSISHALEFYLAKLELIFSAK